MKKTFKKIAALALTFAMAIAPTMVSADSSTTLTSQGELEAYINKSVFNVVLPTSASGSAIDFVADPQGLLNEVDSSAYSKGAGAVYFPDADGAYKEVSSQALKVINKSSDAVDISLSVSIESDSVDVVTSGALEATADNAQISLNVSTVSNSATTVTELGTSGASTTVTSSANALANAYSVVTSDSVTMTGSAGGVKSTALSTSGHAVYYHYQLDQSKTDVDFPTVEFSFSGECNTSDAWSSIGSDAISTSITWTVSMDSAVDLEEVEGLIEYYQSEDTYFMGLNQDVGIEGTITAVKVLRNGTETALEYTVDASDYVAFTWQALQNAGVLDADGGATVKVYTLTSVYTATTTW